jgi:hypothetical protein
LHRGPVQPPDECAATELPVEPKPPRAADVLVLPPVGPDVPEPLDEDEDDDLQLDPWPPLDDERPDEQLVLAFGVPTTALPGAG